MQDKINQFIESQQKALADFKTQLLKELSPKTEFEVGKWYWFNFKSGDCKKKLLLKYSHSKGDKVYYSSAISVVGLWRENDYVDFNDKLNDSLVLATESEVKEALIKEAEKRGFKKGVMVIDLYNSNKTECNGPAPNFVYDSNEDDLYFGGPQIYKQGKWATIVKEEPKLTFGGHEVTIDNSGGRTTGGTLITCKGETGRYDQLKVIYDELIKPAEYLFGNKRLEAYKEKDDTTGGWRFAEKNRNVYTVKIGCTWGTMEEIKKILDACERL